eukprot:866524_1
MKRRAHFVGKAVRYAEEAVAERESSECRSVVNSLSGGKRSSSVGIDQVFKQELEGLESVTFGKLVCHDAHKGLGCVSNCIDAGKRNQPFWKIFAKTGIDNGNIRRQAVGKKWMFIPLVVGNDTKRRYL